MQSVRVKISDLPVILPEWNRGMLTREMVRLIEKRSRLPPRNADEVAGRGSPCVCVRARAQDTRNQATGGWVTARGVTSVANLCSAEGERRDISLYILNWEDAASRTFDGNQFIYLKYGRHK